MLLKSDGHLGLTRRQFCASVAEVAGVLLVPVALRAEEEKAAGKRGASGSWPTARQNRCLTSIQPLAGRMAQAPQIVAEIPFARGQGVVTGFASKPAGPVDRAIVMGNGGLRCYRLDGSLVWEAHPPGLNFETLVAAEDLDGDGRVELALTAGRPTPPLGAAVLLAADTGQTLFRYDLEPMSYWWTMKTDQFVPGGVGKQILVCEHGYPPDAKFGYLAMFEFAKPGAVPRQRWRYDFDHYTCFPTLLSADVDGDGVKEICVETHSQMWVLDPRTGKVNQFLTWDVSPANVRSYGLVRFQDLNGDGLPEFLCLANFSQHHEVLRNDKGRLARAWAHGWDTSVTTQTIETTWPDPPVADVDGDGKLELVVNLFASDGQPRWMVRIYDALTGELKATVPDRIATCLSDVDGDGVAEILADISRDPTLVEIEGVCVLKVRGKNCEELWRQAAARSAPALALKRNDAAVQIPKEVFVQTKAGTRRMTWQKGRGVELIDGSPAPPPAGADLSHIPATLGPALNAPLVADVDGDGRNEVVHWHQGRATLYRYEGGQGFRKLAEYASAAAPALADLDGDGKLEMVVGEAGPTTDPVIHALRPGRQPETLWKVTLTPRERKGLPHGPPLAFQTGRFLGRAGDDLYVYVGTPQMRSLVLDGSNGALNWEKGKIPDLERYYGPTVNLSAVWDVNGDGKDDLVFTCPDYYCVASGPTGEAIVGPAFPPNIFKQPSQGLYTMPVVLPAEQGEPTVCLVDGHYFVAAMTAHGVAKWYRLPVVGEARAGAEGFLKTREGQWLMGYGRQDGQFVCLEVATGKVRWQIPLESTASAVTACDINGDGQPEFLFGTTHGQLYALADAGASARVVWRAQFPAGVGTPIIADVDGDGSSEILVTLGDGRLCLLRAKN
jgi:outer membrane protein assembly factor BamB